MSKHHNNPPHDNQQNTSPIVEEPTNDAIETLVDEEITLSNSEEDGASGLISEDVSGAEGEKKEEEVVGVPENLTTIYLLGMDPAKLGELLDAKAYENPKVFAQKAKTPGTSENVMVTEMDLSKPEILRANKFLTNNISDPHVLKPYIKDEATGKVIANTKKVVITDNVLKEGGMIENNALGTAYILNVINKPVRRIPLYASGISLEIVPPSPQQLTDFMVQVENGAKLEFGYETGFPVYFYLDYGIKVEFMKLLRQIVIDSSLPNWQEKGALEANIQFSDYPALVTHVAAIMFPNGYDKFEHFCSRPADPQYPQGCEHVIKKKIDILNLLLNRGDIIKAGDIAHMQKALQAGRKTTPEELKAYRDSLGIDNKTLTVKTDMFHVELVLKGISMADHLEHAADMIAQLKQAFRDPSREEMGAYTLSRKINAVQVYVQSIKLFDAANPSITKGYVTDRRLIERTLGALASDSSFNDQVIKPIEDFSSSLQLTYIGYPKFKCPACGYLPEQPKTFFVMDPQQVFFTTTWRVLENSTLRKIEH